MPTRRVSICPGLSVSFTNTKKRVFSPETLDRVLRHYKDELDSREARIKVDFAYPMVQKSLRSGLEGYQYYDCSFEGIIDRADRVRKIINFDFIYSSACPCASNFPNMPARPAIY